MLAFSAAGFIAIRTSGASARREYVVVGEMQLEARNAGEGACRGPDFRREIRLGGQVVAEDRGLLGEPVSRELHAVTRVTGEPDDDVIELLDLLGHSWKTSSARRGRALSLAPPHRRGHELGRYKYYAELDAGASMLPLIFPACMTYASPDVVCDRFR
jgi:hypothetical protein